MQKLIYALLAGVIAAGTTMAPGWSGAYQDTLEPSASHQRAARMISQIVGRHHYKRQVLDDEVSEQILDQYLTLLDPNRSFFTVADVDAFRTHRLRMDDFLRQGRLEIPFEIFHVYQARLEDRVSYAKYLLNRDFNFNIEESYDFDRTDLAWPKDREELNEIWRKRVKNDVLSLRLAEQEPEGVKDTLRQRYDRLLRRSQQMQSDDVFQMFINAYTMTVDPHSAYFSPQVSENFRIRMSLSLEGIGAALLMDKDYTTIQRTIPGGPASRSEALKPDDRIVGVAQGKDGEMVNVVGWRLADVVDLIRGPRGTVVRLEMLPKDTNPGGPTSVVTLVRDKIKLEEQAAKTSVIEVGEGEARRRIGVLDVPTFYLDFAARARGDSSYRSTTRDVRALLSELEDEGVDGIVVDLRGNGGGSLTEATELSGLFIEAGPIVQVRNTAGHVEVHKDPDPRIAYGGPLAVLVDRYSASASEIFAGAIQDYHRGIVIGESTFGKGTVQTLIDLDQYDSGSEAQLGQVKITVAQFFRVNGDSTQRHGVVPDITLPTSLSDEEYGEGALEQALAWARIDSARYQAAKRNDIALEHVRALHQSRLESDPVLKLLQQDNQILQEKREQRGVSLQESQRRRDLETEKTRLRERENSYRAARGLEPLPADADEDNEKDDAQGQDEDEEKFDDISLTEAARILNDYIDALVGGRQPRMAGALSAASALEPWNQQRVRGAANGSWLVH